MANLQTFSMRQEDCNMDPGNVHSEPEFAEKMTNGAVTGGGRCDNDQCSVLMEQEPEPESLSFTAPPGSLGLPMDVDHAADMSRSRSPKRRLFDDDEHLRNHKHPMYSSYRDDINDDSKTDMEEVGRSFEVVDLPHCNNGDEDVEGGLAAAQKGSGFDFKSILTNNKGLTDSPYPRFFIVLPGSDPQNYRLYFLCEGTEGCDGSHEHDLRYLSKHEGYPLLNLEKFIDGYGKYVWHVMRAIKHKASTMDAVYASRFQSGLEFIASKASQQQLEHVGELSQERLRHLQTYFDNKDEDSISLLYRIISPDNGVRWVCTEHYRHSYSETVAKTFNTIVEVNSGTFDTRKGTVNITLRTSVLRKEFTDNFRLVDNIYELHLRLPSNTPLRDLNQFQAALVESSVVSLHLAFIPSSTIAEDATFANSKANIVARIMCNRNLEKVSFSKLSHFLSNAAQIQEDLSHLKVLALDTLDVNREIKNLAELLSKCTELKEFYLECLGESVDGALAEIYKGIEPSVRKLSLTALRISCDWDSEVVFNYTRTERDVVNFTVDLVGRSFAQQDLFVHAFWSRIRKLRITSDILAEQRHLDHLKKFIENADSLSDLELSCPAVDFIWTLQKVTSMFKLRNEAVSGKIKRPKSCSLRLTDSQKHDYPTKENYLFAPDFLKQGAGGNNPSRSIDRQEEQQKQSIGIYLPTKIVAGSFFKFARELNLASLGPHLRSFTMPPKLDSSEVQLLESAIRSGPGLDEFSLAISSVKDRKSWTHISRITKKSQEKTPPSEIKVALDLECDPGPHKDFVRIHLPAITSLWCTSPNLEAWFQSFDDSGTDLKRLTELLLMFQRPRMAIKGQLLTWNGVKHMARFLSRCVGLQQLHLIDYPLDPLAWEIILEAINFEALTEISFTGSNFGAGQINTFLKRISKPVIPKELPVVQDTSAMVSCASGSGQPQGPLDKGKSPQSDVEMTPVIQEKKPTPTLLATFSHLGMSETAKMELSHEIAHQPSLKHCSVRFQ
ncbi:hypothetical protein BGZ74_005152 [Mortierella antarctica]|nr:hypothetical protein BGZ74_005152 [Mortierella antarctica]